MAALSRGISFRRQGSSGLSWTDTWSFNEDGELVRKLKDEHQQVQRFAGSSLSRIHDSAAIIDGEDEEQQASSQTCPPPTAPATATAAAATAIGGPSSALERSKSVGSSSQTLPPQKPSPRFFKWLKKALLKIKK